MSCGAPAGSEGFAPPLGQSGAAAQEMESFTAQLSASNSRGALVNGSSDVRFTPTDNDTVAWSSGSVIDNDGVLYTISSGSATVAALTYIYFDVALSPTTLQTSTDPADAVGTGRLLLAIAENIADVTKLINFIALSVPDFSKVWTGAQITANTLTAAHIASLVFTGKTANFDTGTIGGWTLASSELSSGSVKIQATSERILMGSATGPMTGTGIFLGKDGSDYEFRAGNPSDDYIHWNGSSLTVSGTIASGDFTAAVASFVGMYVDDTARFNDLVRFTDSGAIQIEDGRLLEFSDSGVDAGFSRLAYGAGGELVVTGNLHLLDDLHVGTRTGATVAATFSATHYIRIEDVSGNAFYIAGSSGSW